MNNFLSIFVSTFLTNYFLFWILSLLRVRNRQKIALIIISLTNLGSLAYYLYITINLLITGNTSSGLLYIGNDIALASAYIATMMFLLDGKKIFRSRRQKAFMRNMNNSTTPFSSTIIAIIFAVLGLIALAYGIYASINYANNLLWALIGAYGAATALLSLALYILLANQKTTEKAPKRGQNLLFILTINNHTTIYEAKLVKDYDYYLGDLNKIYIPTDYGKLITPEQEYIVKGIKSDYINNDSLATINMSINNNEQLKEVVTHFQRYETKIITIDSNYNIIKEIKK